MYQKIQRIVEVSNSTPANTGVFAACLGAGLALSGGLENRATIVCRAQGYEIKANERLVSEFKPAVKMTELFSWVFKDELPRCRLPGNQMNSVVIVKVPMHNPPRVKRKSTIEAVLDSARIWLRTSCYEEGFASCWKAHKTLDDRGAIVFLTIASQHIVAVSYRGFRTL
jgi:hypothetical protein